MTTRLESALAKARRRRKWSYYEASQRSGVNRNTIRTLEGANPDRKSPGGDTHLRTVLALVKLYWPDITLEDFLEEPSPFRLVPTDSTARRHLKGHLVA